MQYSKVTLYTQLPYYLLSSIVTLSMVIAMIKKVAKINFSYDLHLISVNPAEHFAL